MTAQQVIRVVAAIIERDGKVFAARRNADRSAGSLWEFPGGKIEHGEAPEEALRRELREELSVDTAIGSFMDRSEVTLAGGVLEMSCYAATFTGPDPERSTDHDAMVWIEVERLNSLSWAPADVPIIGRLADSFRDASAGASDERPD